MNNQPIIRDERTITIENASYRWGYMVVTYGLLVIIILRAFLFNQTNWDLFALLFVSGLVTTVYQGVHQMFTRRWIYLFAATMVIAALVAALIAFVLK
jgi:hypothetical protein